MHSAHGSCFNMRDGCLTVCICTAALPRRRPSSSASVSAAMPAEAKAECAWAPLFPRHFAAGDDDC